VLLQGEGKRASPLKPEQNTFQGFFESNEKKKKVEKFEVAKN
tara:strand:- start:2708 stop:2833 length:126 start_codon:yes stop_codon:yes gene_type:complete